MAATVDALPGRGWNAHAVAGDALNRAPITAPIVCLWVDEQGRVCWSRANTSAATLAHMAVALNEMAQSKMREQMSEAGR